MSTCYNGTKLKIYEVLERLIQEKDFRDITITEICQEADVSRMTYYRNFNDKESILFDFYCRSLRETYERLSVGASELTAEDAWKLLFRECGSNRAIPSIIRAGLTGKLMMINEEFLTHIFRDIFGYDMEDPCNRMMMYSSAGAINGFIAYSNMNDLCNDEMFANKVISSISKMGSEPAAIGRKPYPM